MPDEGSTYAEEGTLAHKVAELELKLALGKIKKPTYTRASNKLDAELFTFYGREIEGKNLRDHVNEYVAQVMEIVAETEDVQYVDLEQRVSFADVVPGGFGTADVVIVGDGNLHIIDLKFGKGVAVDAVNNPQLMLYAYGTLEQYRLVYDIETVSMTIIQPRLYMSSTFTVTANELTVWATKGVAPVAKLAEKGEGEFGPSDNACRFCRARAVCTARAEATVAQAVEDFANTTGDPVDPIELFAVTAAGYLPEQTEMLPPERIAAILAHAETFARWYADVQEYALMQARDYGTKYPGFKLVEGRSARKIMDEEGAVERLMIEGLPDDDFLSRPSLLGITALEKNIGKKTLDELIGDLIEKPTGKPCLVPESDKRPEIGSAASAAADFECIEEETK